MALAIGRAIASGNFPRKGTALSQAQPDPRPPLVRRPAFWLVVVAALLLVAVASVVGLMLGAGRGVDVSASGTPTPGTVTTDAATTPPAAETEAPPAAGTSVVVPASCAEIYTRDWSAALGGLVLNPPWTETPGNGPFWGSNDNGVVTVLEATTKLTCAWVGPNGGGDVGIITNLAELTPEQVSSTLAHLASIGQTCYEELGGTRCVVERNSDAGESGESHFIREGIWSATRWSNVVADGYTHDIATALFG
jgi:hypothetical protein